MRQATTTTSDPGCHRPGQHSTHGALDRAAATRPEREEIEMANAIPKEIDGRPTRVVGQPLQVGGEMWVTLVAEGEGGLWEFSLTTGRLIRTAEANDDEQD